MVKSTFRRLATAAMACACSFAVSAAAVTEAGNGEVAGIAFVGRMVANLDKSVAFYKALGFNQDPAADTAWRKDPVAEQLYGVSGIQTRLAQMYVNSNISGERFVVYLRELKGLRRKDQSNHTAWQPGSSHFGLVVPDAAQTWAKLRADGLLHARSWGGELVAPPGQSKGQLAYLTDPDGLDIELIDQRPALPAADGRPATPARPPGISHVGLIILDADKAKAFYADLLGGQLQAAEAPWLSGDFYDSAVGGHGNILRFFNLSFAESAAPSFRMNMELVEFQNRKQPVGASRITDSGVGYVGIEVRGLDALLARAKAAGASPVSNRGIVTMKSGTREIMLRDPDAGGFVLLYEKPQQLPAP